MTVHTALRKYPYSTGGSRALKTFAGLAGPDQPPPGLPPPAHCSRHHFSSQGHQSPPQQCHSRDGLQLPTALPWAPLSRCHWWPNVWHQGCPSAALLPGWGGGMGPGSPHGEPPLGPVTPWSPRSTWHPGQQCPLYRAAYTSHSKANAFLEKEEERNFTAADPSKCAPKDDLTDDNS